MAEPAFQLRPRTPADAPFERAVYAATRADELEAWGWTAPQREAFLDLQFRAQQAAFASRTVQIAEVDEAPAARLVTATSDDEVHLVDIAVLPAFRGRGLGSALVRGLQRDASRVVLEVGRDRPRVADWYRALDFAPTAGGDALTERMVWARGPDRRGVLAGAMAGAAALTVAPRAASAGPLRSGDASLLLTPLDVTGVGAAEVRVRTPGGPSFIAWAMRATGPAVSVAGASRVRVPYQEAPELEVLADGRRWVVRLRHAVCDVALDGRWPLVRRGTGHAPSRPTIRVERRDPVNV